MNLREAVRTIIREVAESELRQIVKEVLLEELLEENPKTRAAKKAAMTRAQNKEKTVYQKTVNLGVFQVGQKYKGKQKNIQHRIIEIMRLDDKFVYPKILGSEGKDVKVVKMSYEHLHRKYERIS